MTAARFPVSLDDLIAYVRSRQPQGEPLAELTEAIDVASRVEEEGDALVGHFVDRARRSGASWSQIGTSMGVSKQAAQKRFVARGDEGTFARFTPRARSVLAAAGAIAGGADVTAGAIVVGLLAEPEGIAARVLADLGADAAALGGAFGLTPVAHPPEGEADLRYAEDADALLRATMAEALRLGHNYVGTEHLLLGALAAEGDAAATLATLGVTPAEAEMGIAKALERLRPPTTP